MGSSGGMKVFNLNDVENFIMVQQDELLEVDANGDMVTPPNRMSMAGGDAQWSALETETSRGGLTVYNAQFTKTDGGKSFSLTAHVARHTVTTAEAVPCSGCSVGEGVCQATADASCSDRDVGPPSICPTGSALCTEPITIKSDTLKFSIVVSGWDFGADTNTLTYGMSIKDKSNGGNAPEVTNNDGVKDIVIPGTGWLQIPTSGLIVGGAEPVPITVGVGTRTQGSQFLLEYDFPHFATGQSLYYDPSLGAQRNRCCFATVQRSRGGQSPCLACDARVPQNNLCDLDRRETL
jgi:hypothetical protein